MFLRVFVFLCCTLGCSALFAQSDEFCEAVHVISRDAPNQFRNIKGRITESNANAVIWASGVTLPGSIGARFVASMGLFYECAFLQTRNKSDLKEPYYMYKSYLTTCLSPLGYTLTEQPNFSPGLDEYKKLVFMPVVREGVKAEKAPSHVALEVTYSKDMGQYTIVLFIFEH